MQVQLTPFSVPKYAYQMMPAQPRQAGYSPAPTFLLSELEPEVLAEMCDDFRLRVFKQAGKVDPALRQEK